MTSRSFAAVIKELDGELARVVSFLFLLIPFSKETDIPCGASALALLRPMPAIDPSNKKR